MPNFASNYTPRVRLTYTSDNVKHNAILRLPRSTADLATDADTLATAWVAFVQALLGTDTIESASSKVAISLIGAAYCDADSNIFIPFEPTDVGAVMPGAGDAQPAAFEAASLVSFSGLSTAGHKWRTSLAGIRLDSLNTDTTAYRDFRLSSSEAGGVSAGIAHLKPLGGVGLLVVAADDNPLTAVYDYMNISISRTAIRKARR